MQTERIVHLALPRGRKAFCELCLAPATVRCGGCGVTFYCEVEHQNADWVSVHEKICQLLIPLRTALPFYDSEKKRKHGREQKISREKFLAEVTHNTAQKFLYEGKHEDAIPAALHSLKFNISVHGLNSSELVPAYLMLAEASLGLGHLSQAEEYLSQARWSVLKTSQCSPAIESKLHRNLGLLYVAKGNFEESLYHLANDIYFASCAFGTNDVAVSGGYFHMANVFFRQNRMDVADSMYTEVTEIWYNHFKRLIDQQYQSLMSPSEINMLPEEETTGDVLDESQQAEATQMLNAILDIREQASKPKVDKIATLVCTLAMFHCLIFDMPKAHELAKKTLHLIKLEPVEGLEDTLHRLVKLIKSKPFYVK
ncbi:zinc finger MYND domain-containing protein 12 [Eublepharis macularius]|uniref:Zinc finger MYND domain-containing protein 12 n=1 Tax=Eublepharis macularius TaxID=481883 RepID=A0AA97KKK5_EUBMA|nr:zinc finger MYND domain-containing protein 12 [Eublepharis macularius]